MYLYVCVSECKHLYHMLAGAHGGQERDPDPPELEYRHL